MAELSEWLTVAEAAAALATSARSIERRIRAGDIEVQHRARPGRKPETVCNPADIDRLKPAAFVMPATLVPVPAPASTHERISPAGTLDLITAALQAAAQREAPEPHRRAWLALDEAAEASGLSAAFLKRQAKAGAIAAVRDGRKWKFHREQVLQWIPAGTKSPKTSPPEI